MAEPAAVATAMPTITEWATIIALILGPVIAVLIGNWQVARTAARERVENRRYRIFNTLMSTRSIPMDLEHVRALNSIEIEFTETRGDRDVIAAWNSYIDFLNRGSPPNAADGNSFANEQTEKLHNLIAKMGERLGYYYDGTRIKNSRYAPQGYENLDVDNFKIRQGVIEVLESHLKKCSTPDRAAG